MLNAGFYNAPEPRNEPVLSYAPGTIERDELKKLIWEYRDNRVDVPMIYRRERD
jgi:1-pyrroline-5-carboxylate dehydrogenase